MHELRYLCHGGYALKLVCACVYEYDGGYLDEIFQYNSLDTEDTVMGVIIIRILLNSE